MSSEDVAISVRNLTKTYRLFGHPGNRVKQFLSFGLKRYHRDFTALEDVSFDIMKGETVGIIGRNGSGKSTLLQLICGILKPTSGSVKVNGRVSALLELGAGFNPEFTGRENVYFQGALRGFSKRQMDERFDESAAFADIGEFIDQPVRTYSSGMFVRLAFSVAISVAPDILVVDEALAVGDARFQAACFGRLRALRDGGATVLLVTHSAEQILLHCDRVGIVDKGALLQGLGMPRSMVNQYVALLSANPGVPRSVSMVKEADCEPFKLRHGYNPGESRSGDGRANIFDFRVIETDASDRRLILELDVVFVANVMAPLYGLFVRTADGITLFATNSEDEAAQKNRVVPQQSGDHVTVRFDLQPNLCAGDYFFSMAVSDLSRGGKEILDRRHDAVHWTIVQPSSLAGMVNMKPIIQVTQAEREKQ